jgi:hypothetical protein
LFILHARGFADVKQRKVVSITTFSSELSGRRSALPAVIHVSTDYDVDYDAYDDSSTSQNLNVDDLIITVSGIVFKFSVIVSGVPRLRSPC